MKTLNLVQGSPEWIAHRAKARNASDAPAMLGCSPYMTRSELLHALHTGLRPEAGPEQQRRFDAGHAIEAAQRPAAEEIVGEDLYPCVGVETLATTIDGSDALELSASFDGITMDETTVYECKTLNDDLRAALQAVGGIEANDGRNLPKHYRVQMQQQLMVCGGKRVLFVAASADGNDVRRCWYYPDAELAREIMAGWRQLDTDLAAYVPPAASTVEKIVPEPVEALPAPVIQVSGQLTLQDNFKVFEQRLRHFLAERLIREPKTDQDFVDLDAQIKAMKKARESLNAAEAQMLAQVQPVDQAKKTKDMLDTLLQQNVSMAERLLKEEKDRRKRSIVEGGSKALAAHITGLNTRLGKAYMPTIEADFPGKVHGLKSLASMENAVATELARAKIAANEVADKIDANLKALREHAKDHAFLFADTATLVLKAPDDCLAVIKARIAEHAAAEEKRLEAEREKIRKEEADRLERERQEKEAAAAREQEEQRRREHNEASSRALGAISEARAADALPGPLLDTLENVAADLTAGLAVGRASDTSKAATAAPSVVQMPARAAAPAAPSGPPTLKLGEINARLAPLSLTADGMRQLGFEGTKDRGAVLFHEQDWLAICDAVVTHVQDVRDQRAAA